MVCVVQRRSAFGSVEWQSVGRLEEWVEALRWVGEEKRLAKEGAWRRKTELEGASESVGGCVVMRLYYDLRFDRGLRGRYPYLK